MNLLLKQCTLNNINDLIAFSEKCYFDTFKDLNTEENMACYLKDAFNYNKIKDELMNEHSYFYFLYADNSLAGYLKLNTYLAQTDIMDTDSLEIERIYIAKQYAGHKLGQYLMNKALEFGILQKKEYVWLGVWEKNTHAISFYEKNGFYKINTHSFWMGEEEQCDFIMRRDLR